MTRDSTAAAARRSHRQGKSEAANQDAKNSEAAKSDGAMMSSRWDESAAPERERHPVRTTVRIVIAAVLVFLLACIATAVHIGVVASTDDRTTSDAIVVLGASQFNGTPSPVLQARLSQAQELLRAGVSTRIVTVGGKQEDDHFTEAQAGKTWLVKAGVPAEQIAAVTTGSDTAESLRAVAKLMAEKGWRSATLVTDPVHEARSQAIAQRLGIETRLSPTTRGAGSEVTPDYLARETLGLMHFWVWQRWRMSPVLPAQ